MAVSCLLETAGNVAAGSCIRWPLVLAVLPGMLRWRLGHGNNPKALHPELVDNASLQDTKSSMARGRLLSIVASDMGLAVEPRLEDSLTDTAILTFELQSL